MRHLILSLLLVCNAAWAMDDDTFKEHDEALSFILDRIVNDDEWAANSHLGPKQFALKWRQPLPTDWDVYYRLAVMRDLWVLANTGNPPKAHPVDTDGIKDAKAPSEEWTKILQFTITSMTPSTHIDETIKSKFLTILTRHRARPFASKMLFPTDQKPAFPGGALDGAPKPKDHGYLAYDEVVAWLATGPNNKTEYPIHVDRLIALVGSDAKQSHSNIVVGRPAADMPEIGLQLRIWKQPGQAATLASSFATNQQAQRTFVAVSCPPPIFTRIVLDRILNTPPAP